MYYAQKPLIDNILWVASDTGMPLYNILLWNWTHIFGISELSVRFLSVIFGTASIYLIGIIGKNLFNKKTGLIASVILALAPIHIYYSQEARCYALFVFLTLLSFYFFFELLEQTKQKKINRSIFWLYILSSILLIYTHMFSFFVFLIQNIIMIGANLRNRKVILKWFISQAIIITAFLPWLPFFIKQIKRAHSAFWIAKPTIDILLDTVDKFSGGIILTAIFSVLIIFLVYQSVHKKQEWKKIIMLLAWLIIPPLMAYTYSILFNPLYVTRYLLCVLPAYYLIIARSINMITKKTIQYGSVILIVILLSSASFSQLNMTEKPDWRSAAEYITNNAEKDDAILLQPFYQIEPFSYYYSKECFKTNVYYCGGKKVHVFGITDVNSLEQRTDYINQTIWFIQSDAFFVDINDTVFKELNATKKLTSEKEFNQIKIYTFEQITN